MAYPRLLRNFVLIAIAAGLTACGSDEGFVEGQVPIPTAFVRVINTIPDSPTLSVSIDNRSQGTIGYNISSGFLPLIPGIPRSVDIVYVNDDELENLFSLDLTVDVDASTTLILSGTMANPEIIELPGPTTAFEETDTFSEINFIHAATGRPETTTFLLVADGDFAGAISETLAQFTQSLTLQPGASENAEIYALSAPPATGAAPADDTILWRSGVFELPPRSRALLTLTDYFGPEGNGVRMLNVGTGATATFTTEDLPAALRIAHLAPDQDMIDIYVNELLLGDDITFTQVSDYLLTSESGTVAIKVTPGNDPDTVLLESEPVLQRGSFQTLVVSGLASNESLGIGLSRDDNRPIPTRLQFTGINGAPTAGVLDYYLTEVGASLEDNRPALLSNGLLTVATVSPPADDYDLTITTAGTTDVLFGPATISLENDKIYRFFATDAPGDDGLVQVIFEDDFLP